MKQALLAALLGGAAAGGVSAALVATVLTPAPEPGTPAALASTPRAGDALSAGQLDRISEQLTDLAMRLEFLEARGVERTQARTAEAARLDEQRLDEVTEMLATLSTPGSAVDPLFQSKVAAALERIEDEREQAEEQAEFERIQQEVDERLERLQGELGLDAGQKNEMRTLLVDQRVKRNELFRAMRSGDAEFSRDDFRTMRDEAEAALQAVLTPTQFEAYQQSERDDRRRWFGGGPGGGPGGGGDGGRGDGGRGNRGGGS